MKEVIEFLQNEINQKHIPGAVLQVSHKGQAQIKRALGFRIDYENEQQPMEIDTIFDIASLTKVVATLPSVLKLIDDKQLKLSDSISSLLPEFSQNNKESVTVEHLLTHTSGLPSHRKFYKENLSKDEIFNAIMGEKLISKPGIAVNYSDLGFMLLGKIVETVIQNPFEKFATDEIFKPLGMNETSFRPDFPQTRYAATEYNEALQTYKIGAVHDNNAEAMGGISGHAGLFSTLADLSHFVQMIENDGVYQGNRILSAEIVRQSKQNFTSSLNENRGLGWQLGSEKSSPFSTAFPDSAYGHTGFTGTSLWFDPKLELSIILLTNRVHYGRAPEGLYFRPEVHKIIRNLFY